MTGFFHHQNDKGEGGLGWYLGGKTYTVKELCRGGKMRGSSLGGGGDNGGDRFAFR